MLEKVKKFFRVDRDEREEITCSNMEDVSVKQRDTL